MKKTLLIFAIIFASFLFSQAVLADFPSYPTLPHTVPWNDEGREYTQIFMVKYTHTDPDVIDVFYCTADFQPVVRFVDYGSNIRVMVTWTSSTYCHTFEAEVGGSSWIDPGLYPVNYYQYIYNVPYGPYVFSDMWLANSDLKAEYTQNWDGNFGVGSVTVGDTLLAGVAFGGGGPPQLTVTRSPEAGGGVASLDEAETIQCGVNSNNFCEAALPLNSEIELQAYPSTGYEFVRFEWNNGASSTTENPHVFTIDARKEVEAVFRPVLEFPLSGTLGNRTIAKGFGDDWSFGQCPTGTNKLHAGIDISATANETVKAASAGEIKLVFEDTSEYHWGWCMVIEHDSSYTTTYWHLNDPRNAQIHEGATVIKGQSIGTVKDMSTNTHFHFGVRMHTYASNNIPNAGALPQDDCGIYPSFPECFIDPSALTYE